MILIRWVIPMRSTTIRGRISVVMTHSSIWIIHIMLHILLLLRCSLRWWWRWFICCFFCHVFLHLVIETDLVFGGHVFILLLLFWCQCSPALSHARSQLNKLDTRSFLHNLWSHVKSEEYKRSASAFWGIRILHFLCLAVLNAVIFDKIALRVMPRGGDINSHRLSKTSFILSSTSIPCGFLFWCHALVHCGCILSKLSKSHAGVLSFKLITHRILIKEISRHVAFRCVGITLGFATASSRRTPSESHHSVSFRVKPRGWNIVCQLLEIACLVSFSSSNPCLFLFGS
mmetsp:Transcript_32483/g.48094  ORF Transcript_32483/g.48094 Transcript_32483/m.48094 type:complete len:287 (+) Transcript_32483:231-1091(+)